MISINTYAKKNVYPTIVGLGLDEKTVDRIIDYLGIKTGYWTAPRRRKSTTPEFSVMVRDDEDNFVSYDACIVVSAALSKGDTVKRGPVAVAMMLINEQEWYFLILHDAGLSPSEIAIRYDGEPEDLLERPYLFDVE